VLLGEPGSGKTTTLLSLAGELAAAAQNDPQASLPLFVRLGHWTDPDQDLPAFIAAELGPLGDYLPALCDEGRAVPLLDGMNEIPVAQRAAKYAQIKAFITRYPAWMAVASCRAQDYTVDLHLDRITITPLDALRVREFVTRYLGPDRGETLFWKIAGESARRFEARFAERFADKLADWRQVFWLRGALPDGIAWKEEFVNTYYYSWDRWRARRDAPGSLMQLAHNPYMLSMLTQVYVARGDLPPNRGELFREFVETLLVREQIVTRDPDTGKVNMTPQAEALLAALAALAYEMQVQRGQADDGSALTVLPRAAAQRFLDERQLYLAGSTSILDLGDGVRFTHQLLQEYFAATYMDRAIQAGRLAASDIWPPQRWWERTNWEEAVILLAGLCSDDCARIVTWANAANPEVAALCAVRSGARLDDAVRDALRDEWVARLTDVRGEPEPQARAAVGRALGLTGWDNRPGVANVERNGVKLPDLDWVKIPGGKFLYGHKDESDNPPQTLDLPTFHISRYPVTYVQFQAFIDDPAGFYDARWWEGLALPEDHNAAPGDQAFKFWNHPRERVSWYNAIAFCRWLSWRMGGGWDLDAVDTWAVRLPTEFEWEKAARGTDGRVYPYGNEYDPAKSNTNDTGLQQTSAVGMFPHGASPYGVLDMSGNVWQWCLTDYSRPAPDAAGENLRSNNWRVLRGGAWNDNQDFARAVVRSYGYPFSRYYGCGFRVVRPPSL
jgi:formylglycine-generating enzyme required for sulfatase activity